MNECRYYGKCGGTCDGRGLCIGFGNMTYDCESYMSMPDTKALLALADKIERKAKVFDSSINGVPLVQAWRLLNYADKIRDACWGE